MDTSSALENLIERVRRGDRAAFDRLAARYRPRLESVIRLRLPAKIRHRVDTEDVLQDTLLRAFRGMSDFRWEGRSQFISWLTTLAERTCADLFRKHVTAERASVDREISLTQPRAAGSSVNELAQLLDAGHTGPSQLMRREERLLRLERAMEELSDSHREVLVLSLVQRVPTGEIAARLAMTIEAVCMLRSRALRKVRDLFGTTDSCRLADRELDLRPGETTDADGTR